uniref:Protein kinase domain-containing protein n=1 Tax=Ditylenchus dipsaci TaxID=166011 RepID=A0A915CLE5_9BILA
MTFGRFAALPTIHIFWYRPCVPTIAGGILRTSEDGGLDSESRCPKSASVTQKTSGHCYFDYVAKEQDDCHLKEVLCDEDGWMLAKVDNKKGMVPKTHWTGRLSAQGTFKGKTVALKIPRPQPTSLKVDTIKVQAKVREALEREALIFYPLLLVLELCEGGTLFSLCRKMSEDPLVHADLKADNVLIKERPLEHAKPVVVSDSIYSPSKSLTWTFKEFEHQEGQLWWFMFLWEVLSCQAPFSNYDFHVVMYAVVRKEKTLHVPENCPMELRDVFSQCWKRDTKKRPSFSQILQLLEVAEKKLTTATNGISKKKTRNDQPNQAKLHLMRSRVRLKMALSKCQQKK